MTITAHLYSTSHCHLCELAESMLASLSPLDNVQWMSIEITDDPALLAQYEVKIPVLKRLDNGHEIAWPFNQNDIQALLSAI